MKLSCFIIIILILQNCASIVVPQKVMVKRDRYGESPVIDFRNARSLSEYMALTNKEHSENKK